MPRSRLCLTVVMLVAMVITMAPRTSSAFGGGGMGGGGSSSDQTVKDTWVAGFQAMAAQLSASLIQTAGMIGTMMDGQSVNQAELAMQKLESQAYRDYTPGENLCRFGTLTRSIGAADNAMNNTATQLQQVLLDREVRNGPHGNQYADYDQIGKFKNLSTLYCDPGDNDATPVACACDMAAGTCDTANGPLPRRSNRDLDFARLVDTRRTLNLNFADGTLTPDEQDILSFLSNLTAFQILPGLTSEGSKLTTNPEVATAFQNARALTASRGVVRNTLTNLAARKAAGGEGVSPYMINALRELGMSDGEAERMIQGTQLSLARGGGDINADVGPSYDATMEVLTKTIYQNPNFYTNLVDKPANVLRTQAAMAAIGLMQRRDLYETTLRRELVLSQLLETALRTEEEIARGRVQMGISNND